MTATPKPRAGEHTKGHTILERARIAEQESAEENLGKSLGQAVNAHHSAMKAVEAERDLLKEQKAELVEALTDLLVPEGSISFPNHHPLVRRAREVLAKHGR